MCSNYFYRCRDIIEQLCNRDKQKRKETQNLRGSPTLCWLRPRAGNEEHMLFGLFSDYIVVCPTFM